MLKESKKREKIYIGRMLHADFPEILEIDAASFLDPFTLTDLAATLNADGMVGASASLRDGTLVGYMIYQLRSTAIHLHTIAVRPGYRRIGVGRTMTNHLNHKLMVNQKRRIVTHIPETNLGGQLFYRATGWRAIKVVRGYYQDTGEDAFRFRRMYQGES